MIKMTVQEAINRLTEIETTFAKSIKSLLEQQARQIEALKCCGNCKWQLFKNVTHLPTRCQKIMMAVASNDKCDKWEAQ